MINFVLERQAKSIDELLHRLIEERDGRKPDTTSVNHSSSTCAVGFTQTNPHTSVASVGDTSMLKDWRRRPEGGVNRSQSKTD
jgi:hypothetical protein